MILPLGRSNQRSSRSPSKSDVATLALQIADLRQLFNSMDPAPFHERDLDPTAVAYILNWASQLPASRSLALNVQAGRGFGPEEDTGALGAAVSDFFLRRSCDARLQLRELFRTGRISLLIGFAFLAVAILVGDFVAGAVNETYAELVRESFVIGGWVALWRPLEIFLYQWWPILGQVRLYRRLSQMSVHFTDVNDLSTESCS